MHTAANEPRIIETARAPCQCWTADVSRPQWQVTGSPCPSRRSFFDKKDEGAWTIPKGEVEPGEDLLTAAQREFEEEIGVVPAGPFIPLTPVKQKGGQIVHAWAFEGDCDPAAIVSNTFTLEWPPHSGRRMEFPEIDRAEFFEVAVVRRKIKAAQVALIDELKWFLSQTG
jgi:predicted NUDIX family NTP pyrophosphohydrolase